MISNMRRTEGSFSRINSCFVKGREVPRNYFLVAVDHSQSLSRESTLHSSTLGRAQYWMFWERRLNTESC